MTWENVKTLLHVIEMAQDHGPQLKDIRDHALALLAAVDVNDLHHESQPLEEE